MPRFARFLHARGLRASRVAMTALVVALASAMVAVVLGSAPRATATAAPAPAPVAPPPLPDGLAAEQELAAALAERPSAPVEASRAAEAPRPTVVWPAAGAVTGVFGERRGRGGHPGLDIDGITGDPVWAAAAGVVAWAGWAPAGYSGYGTMVLVDHGDSVQTLYAHLSAVAVSVGDRVEPGDRLGSIGTTGYVTGSHLHFEVRRHGVIADPTAFLPAR